MEASPINAPHPDDKEQDEADLFFGGEDENESSSESEPQAGPTEEAKQAMAEAKAAQERAAEVQKAREAEDPTPLAESDGQTEDPQPPAAESSPTTPPAGEPESVPDPPTPAAESVAASAGDSGSGQETGATGGQPGAGEGSRRSSSGDLTREYVVLHKVPLTKRALEHLLKEINGRGGEARIAYLAIEPRPVARNDRAALSQIYREYRDELGDEPTLVAVSARSFTERKVRPKARPVEESIEIS